MKTFNFGIILLLLSILLLGCSKKADELPDWQVDVSYVDEAYIGEPSNFVVKVSKKCDITLYVDGTQQQSVSSTKLNFDVSTLPVGLHNIKISINDGYGTYDKSYQCRIKEKPVVYQKPTITCHKVEQANYGESSVITASTKTDSEMTLYVDGAKQQSTTSKTLSFDVVTLSVGTHQIKIVAVNGDKKDEVSFNCEIVDNTPVLSCNTIERCNYGETAILTASTQIDSKITLYVDGAEMQSSASRELRYDVSELPVGTHQIKIVAVNGDKEKAHSFELEVVAKEIEQVELLVKDLNDFLTTKANNQTIYDVKILDPAPNCDDIIKLLNENEKIKIKLDLECCTELSQLVVYDCEGLISLKTPHNITYLNVVCDALEEIHFNCTSFNLVCPNLNSVVINQTTPPKKHYWSYNDEYGNLKLNSYCKIYVPASAEETFKTANGWEEYASQIIPMEFEMAVDEYSYVDLGLPSGTLWATCNVGAENPWDYGDYFAWGEVTTKDYYDWDTYKYCKGTENTMTKYCNESEYGYNGYTDNLTVLESEDDAATVNMGSDWRMPTQAEFQELKENCDWEWTDNYNGKGVSGYIVKSRRGSSLIFLPAAGYRHNFVLGNADSFGGYWSSSVDYRDLAWRLTFLTSGCSVDDGSRYCGFSVRPVRCKN